MVTIDRLIGFEAEPTGLEEYLTSEGFTIREKIDDFINYFRENAPPEENDIWPEVMYVPVKKGNGTPVVITEEPWGNSKFNIIAEVNVNYDSHSGPEMTEEADRLADEITRRFNGVKYESELEQYYTKDDLGN